MPAEMIDVESGNLDAVGYNGNTGELLVRFNSGKTAAYQAPVQVFQELLAAPSKGQYFNSAIRSLPFRYVEE